MGISVRSLSRLLGLGLVAALLLGMGWSGIQNRKRDAAALEQAKRLVVACSEMTALTESVYRTIGSERFPGLDLIVGTYADVLSFNSWSAKTLDLVISLEGTKFESEARGIAQGISKDTARMLDYSVRKATTPSMVAELGAEYWAPVVIDECAALRKAINP